MTVDELRALVIECAGESVVREAEAVDQVQAHTVLANLVADWNAGKDFDPGVYDFLLGRIVLSSGGSSGWRLFHASAMSSGASANPFLEICAP